MPPDQQVLPDLLGLPVLLAYRDLKDLREFLEQSEQSDLKGLKDLRDLLARLVLPDLLALKGLRDLRAYRVQSAPLDQLAQPEPLALPVLLGLWELPDRLGLSDRLVQQARLDL